MFRTKSVVAAITVATMVASSAFAAESTSLAPGKPAGVHNADLGVGKGTLLVGLGVVGIITAVAIVVSNNNGGNSTPGSLGQAGNGVTPATSS